MQFRQWAIFVVLGPELNCFPRKINILNTEPCFYAGVQNQSGTAMTSKTAAVVSTRTHQGRPKAGEIAIAREGRVADVDGGAAACQDGPPILPGQVALKPSGGNGGLAQRAGVEGAPQLRAVASEVGLVDGQAL